MTNKPRPNLIDKIQLYGYSLIAPLAAGNFLAYSSKIMNTPLPGSAKEGTAMLPVVIGFLAFVYAHWPRSRGVASKLSGVAAMAALFALLVAGVVLFCHYQIEDIGPLYPWPPGRSIQYKLVEHHPVLTVVVPAVCFAAFKLLQSKFALTDSAGVKKHGEQ